MSILVSVYFSCLFAFCFVVNPIIYCVLLLSSALSISGVVYLIVGFSWYLVLFCLVYVGGVYVLFIFISIHSPNPASYLGGSSFFLVLFFLLCLIFFGWWGNCLPCVWESSHYLCSYFEGVSYCLFCLVLLVGFMSVSVVAGSKDSFFR